jgi:quercetin 2,3-dioxygenase
LFDGAEAATLEVLPDRRVYVHVARGRVDVNGTTLNAGDALKLADVRDVTLTKGQDAEVLVFDLP